jgi:hypothetical protein
MSVWRGIIWGDDFECRIRREVFRVHSVFHKVTNLQADPSKPLLSVVTCMEAMGPNAMFVKGGGLDEFKVGSSVEFGSGQLVAGSIRIDCLAAEKHVTELKANSRGIGSWYGSAIGSDFVQERGAHQRVQAWVERMSPGLTKVRSPLTEQLTQGLLTEDEGLVRLALAGFIGRGEGLTPAGDDFVAGILLSFGKGFQLTGQTSAFLARLPCLVEEVWGRTTTISQTMLWYAARGDGARYVAEMAEALLEESGRVLELAARLWTVGASSGRYLLAGVLLGSELFMTREHDKLGRNNGNTSEYLRRFSDPDGLIAKGTKA